MNSYTKHVIEKFHQKYISRTFDQDDVAFFLMISRDYSSKNTIFRELGDFLAHPDLKDRGLVIDNLNPAVDYFNENFEAMLNGLICPNSRHINYGISLEDIIKNLNFVFGLVGIKKLTIKRHDLSFRDFIFCLIFILSNFKLKLDNRVWDFKVTYGHSLEIKIKYSTVQLPRYYIQVLIMSLDNVWTSADAFRKINASNHIVRRFSNGNLGAIPYQYDVDEYLKGFKNLPKGIGFPLPDYYI